VAAGSKPAEEFRFFDVEPTEPGSARLWVRVRCQSRDRHRCKSIERSVPAVRSSAESVSVGALGLGSEQVGVGCESVRGGLHDSALIGELGTQSNRSIRESTIKPECKHQTIVSQCKHEAIQSEREFSTIVAKWRG